MKNNNFETEYSEITEIKSQYEEAIEADDDDLKSLAKARMNSLRGDIEAKGDDYEYMFSLYEDARDKGNEYLDIDNLNNGRVAAWVELVKVYGIERFTFSSTWSGAVEQAWELQKAGCNPIGLVEINKGYRSRFSDYEKGHAWLFEVR